MKTKLPTQIAGYAFIILLMVFLCCCQSSSPNGVSQLDQELPERVDFNFHIKPILSDRCFKCHGPDEKVREANLRFDTKEGAFALLDSTENSYAIVPGSLKKSLLVHRISNTDPDIMMPPPESNLHLSAFEIKLFKKWIEQGAEWKAHWSFIPPEKPDLPKIKKKTWPRNEIDHFTLAKMESKGLQPANEASKEKLIRRLSFDLRGIPPSLAEIDAFLADESPNAYGKLVDQFLEQDSFGERMGMEWMDLARYADSHGYQDDLERSMWPWRDWVIQAFNQNMPYDQFVSWQLGGDLLPEATYEQKLATGFNRNHKITQEVGVINEEYRVTYVLDRVNTFSTAFLGLTVECAQCHDHKYDPISQKEYYSLFSFFNNVPEKGRVDYGVEVAKPSLPLPEEKVKALRTYIRDLFHKQQNKLDDYISEQWEKGFEVKELEKTSSSLPNGLLAWYPLDYIEQEQTPEAVKSGSARIINDLIPIPGKYSGGVEFMGTNYAVLDPNRTFHFSRPFSISFWINSLDGGIRGTVLSAKGKEQSSFFSLAVTSRKTFNFSLFNKSNKSRFQFLSKATVPENKWTHITVTHDGTQRAKGFKLYMDGVEQEELFIRKNNLKGTLPFIKGLYLGAQNPKPDKPSEALEEMAALEQVPKGLEAGQIDELMFFNRALDSMEVKELTSFDPISELLALKNKNETQLKRLFYNQLFHQDLTCQALTERLREYKIRKVRTEDIIVKPTMVMADMDTIRPTFVLNRGQYDAQGERVETGTPKAILAFNQQYENNRLGLAKWLFDAQNPLTARVAVNRYWQMIFGKGIVATPEDFGSQGALPSHPELLDWLAVEFRESGWDVRQLIKKMVTSATYCQSVASNARLQQIDPENIYLARGPQLRLSAEMIRDHALSISGLLSTQVGGPSVKPYQPQGLWLQVASGNQSLRKYIQDHEQSLYRRSLYTFWKRTIPPPSMTVFDAPSREQCVLNRRATSTPMQALVLLNDPQFTEASRLIATRMLNEGGTSIQDRIEFAFRLATSRHPKQEEVQLLTQLLEQEKADYASRPEAADKLIAIGEYPAAEGFEASELAAYTVTANAILNLTEAIMK